MVRRPLTVNVTAVLRSGTPRREVLVARIDDLFVTGSAVPAGTEVEVDAFLEPLGPALQVTATVSTAWEGDCRRCLAPARGSVRATVRELFEEDPVEDETWPLLQGQIDLEPLVRETVLLELPPAPLCHEGCQGLCPRCGQDRNTGGCSCEPPIDPRWSALDELRPES